MPILSVPLKKGAFLRGMREGERMDGKRTGWKYHRARGGLYCRVAWRDVTLFICDVFLGKINNRLSHSTFLSSFPLHQRGRIRPQFAPASRSAFRAAVRTA